MKKSILDSIKNNEDNLTSIIYIAGIIIAVAIIIFMWAFSFKSVKKNPINTFVQTDLKTEVENKYEGILSNLLKASNSEKLFAKMDIKYLNNNNLNENNFKEFIIKEGYVGNAINFISTSVSSNEEGVYLYRFYYKNYSDFKYVNVIEVTPNEYYISFDQNEIPDTARNSKIGTTDDIKYELLLKEYNDSYVKLLLKIENINLEDMKININDINTFSLRNNGIYIPLSGVVTSSTNILSTNSSVLVELNYNVDITTYLGCSDLVIRNVSIGSKEKDIFIEL